MGIHDRCCCRAFDTSAERRRPSPSARRRQLRVPQLVRTGDYASGHACSACDLQDVSTSRGGWLVVRGSEADGVEVVLDVDGRRSSAVALSKSSTTSSKVLRPGGDVAPATTTSCPEDRSWRAVSPSRKPVAPVMAGRMGTAWQQRISSWERTGSTTIRVIGA